jgi:hypothetical protein
MFDGKSSRIGVLGGCAQLTHLDLSRNYMSSAGAAVLPALARLSSLCELNLAWTGIHFQGTELTALASCTRLRTLDLTGNRISVGGIAALGQLASLEDFAMGSVLEAHSLAHSLLPFSRLSALTRLTVQSSCIGIDTLESLPALTSLRDLNLSSVEEDADAEHIGRLTMLTALSLGIDHHAFSPSYASAWTEILGRLPQLQRLVYMHTFGVAFGEAMLSALAQLQALRELEMKVGELSVQAAIDLAGISTLKRLVLTVPEPARADMEGGLAVLSAAPGLDFESSYTVLPIY